MRYDRIILHIDVNSAFLSWSAVRRLKENPGSTDLRTVPAVVGGDQATRHGIVTARSIPAKAFGIRTAETVASAMRKCPGLIVIPPEFDVYREYSGQFMSILRSFTAEVEKASIDEAYMDVTALCGNGEDQRERAVSLASAIRDRIRKTLGFTVNAGVSCNKLLAKMASDFSKPDKTHTLFPEEVPEKMWGLPIRSLYGCGAQTAARLQGIGIRTIGEAAAQPLIYLQSLLGEKAGLYIHRAANGLSDSLVNPVREEPKSVSNETTLSADITLENCDRELPPVIAALSEKVAGRLQAAGYYAGTVQVSVKTSGFVRRSMQTRLPDSTNSAGDIKKTAMNLAERLLKGDGDGLLYHAQGIRLVGVGTADLTRGEYRQMNLFQYLAESGQKEEPAPASGPAPALPDGKRAALEEMTRSIRGKYGKKAISKGVETE